MAAHYCAADTCHIINVVKVTVGLMSGGECCYICDLEANGAARLPAPYTFLVLSITTSLSLQWARLVCTFVFVSDSSNDTPFPFPMDRFHYASFVLVTVLVALPATGPAIFYHFLILSMTLRLRNLSHVRLAVPASHLCTTV